VTIEQRTLAGFEPLGQPFQFAVSVEQPRKTRL
jgi:hypothetical protein